MSRYNLYHYSVKNSQKTTMTQNAPRKLISPKLASLSVLSVAMLLSGCVMVRVVDPVETQFNWDVDTAISLCLKEVTGKSIEALDRIDYDTHLELEDCVNEKVPSKERIVLEYHGSKKGLVPRAK